MAQNLPYIFKKKTELCPNGQIIKETQLTVQGNELEECKKIFDKEWGKEK